MRITFDKQMGTLHDRLVEMCSFVEKTLRDCKVALVEKDKELAKDIHKRDYIVDDMEREIETLCTTIILRQQPVATDLRKITAALKIITDLERIGDQTQDISAIIMNMNDHPYKIQLKLLSQMFEEVAEMLKIAIDAYIVYDLDLALTIKDRDDIVDNLFSNIRKNCINAIKENSEDAAQVVDLIQVAKYLERIGDHAENISEWVIYIDTGSHKELYK